MAMKITVYNQEGKEVGQTLLPKEIFDVKVNPDLVHHVTVSQMANRRISIAHTKGRGEVRGGGRKPWRQKGTGRARAGSIRSPLWRGGGVTFGPTKERVFKKKINRKIKRKAFLMVLSAKAKNNLILILDSLKLNHPKTNAMAQILGKLPVKGGSCLIALPKVEKNLILAARNLPKIEIIEARNLNVLDLLSFKYLIMPKESIKVIQNTFAKPTSERGRVRSREFSVKRKLPTENPSVRPSRETGFPPLAGNVRNRGFLKSGVGRAKARRTAID